MKIKFDETMAAAGLLFGNESWTVTTKYSILR